jgi:hypothetical protein
METVTRVRKPATLINVAYFTSILIGALVLFGHYQYTEASPALVNYCERQFNTGFFREVSPRAKERCSLIFDKMSYEYTT